MRAKRSATGPLHRRRLPRLLLLLLLGAMMTTISDY